MRIIILLLLILTQCSVSSAYAAQESHFAQITQSGTYLYKNLSNELICELPESYFVSVISQSNEYYYVEYLGIKGYVRQDNVTFVSETPKEPYLTSSKFRVFSTDGCILRKLPTSRSSILTRVELYSSLTYIGEIQGEELVVGRGTKWYYTTFTTKDGEILYGYIYSGLCDGLDTYPLNTEKVTYIDKISFSEEYVSDTPKSSFNTLVILILVLSCVALYMLYLPFRIKKSTRRKYSKYENTTPNIFYDDML